MEKARSRQNAKTPSKLWTDKKKCKQMSRKGIKGMK